MSCSLFWRVFVFAVVMTTACFARAQEDPVITLRRTGCLGTCPVYSVKIFADGSVTYFGTAFVQITGEHETAISREAVENLVSHFLQINYFALKDRYETRENRDGTVTTVSDLPTTYSSLRVGNRTKSVMDYAFAPSALKEVELEVDRAADTHRWIHGDQDDLKEWKFVGPDVYTRIKPGMNLLMQAAGQGDLNKLRREHEAGADINAADETGWTALMLASEMCQEQTVRQLLDWGARVNLKDKNGDTALIGASAAFCTNDETRDAQALTVQLLLQRGALADEQDIAGKTALMTVTTYGNVRALRVLMESGARPELRDKAGRSALDFARTALKNSRDRFWTSELQQVVAILEAKQ